MHDCLLPVFVRGAVWVPGEPVEINLTFTHILRTHDLS